VFTVSLSTPSTQTVTVVVRRPTDGNRGSDYTAVGPLANLAPGVTSQTVAVPIIGDTTDEPDETFTVNLGGRRTPPSRETLVGQS
jgi:hypothetical protein